MKSKINTERVFEPVTVEITLESWAELQEFELRIALYYKYLLDAAHKQTDLGHDIPTYVKGVNAATGIKKLRKQLHDYLGNKSFIKNPRWLG